MPRTVSIKLLADVSQYTREIGGRAVGATKQLSGELDKAAKGGHLDAAADRAAVLGVGLVGVAGAAVKMRMDFDKAMSGVQAATHNGAAEMGLLRNAALEAGKSTQYSATESANAITELSKAGVSTADVLGGGLKGALSLAAAGQLDVGEAAETAASAMTQFGLKGKDIPHIADLLAAGAGKAQGSVHDMGAALSQSGLVASQFGLSVEDTTGTLAAFASAGLIGSDAGTSFKTMLLSLANPADKTKAAMDDLGISAYDAQGKFVGITGLAEQLKTKLGGLTQAQRDQTLAMIFGTDAIRAANVLYNEGGAGIQKWIGKVNDAGYASQTAAALTDNLAGDLERLKGSLETFAIESGGGASGGLRVLTKSANALVDQLSLLPNGVTGTMTVLAALGGATALAAAGWVKMRRSTADALEELRSTGPVGEKAAVGLEKTTKWAGRAAAAFALTQAAAAGVNAAFGSDLNPQIDALEQSLNQWAATGAKSGEAARLLGDDFSHLSYDLGTLDSGFWTRFGNGAAGVAESISGLGGVMDESLQHAKERLTAIDSALQQMVQNGQSQQAAAIFAKLADEAKKSGVSVDELKKGLPGYAAALQTAGTSTSGTAAATQALNGQLSSGADQQKKFTTATDAAAGAARGQRDALKSLADFMKAETDPVFGLIKAEQDLADAQKTYSKAVKDHGKNSAEAKQADRELALAAIALQGAVGDVSSGFDGKMTPALKRTLQMAGLSKAEIHGLEKQFQDAKKAADKYNGKYEAKASAPGAVQAKKELDNAYASAHHLDGTWEAKTSAPGAPKAQKELHSAFTEANLFDGSYKARVSVTGDADAMIRLRALNIEQNALRKGVSISTSAARALAGDTKAAKDRGVFAAGGWTGPGSTYDEAGVVHADEFVVNKKARGALEDANPGGLDYMNQTGKWPGYAGGGRVWPFPATAAMTRIPSRAEALAVVAPAFTGGGATDDWIVRTVHARFPALNYISKFRPGARTLTGNVSYHARHRAVDWPPYYDLAKWWHDTYMSRTKELITPWNELNIHNGRPHRYTGAVWNQHNFAGGNAHDHIAMANGGVINEPVFGFGASGRSYSFGERGAETVTPGVGGGGTVVNNISFTAVLPAGANPAEHGRQIAHYLEQHFARGGEIRVNGRLLVGN